MLYFGRDCKFLHYPLRSKVVQKHPTMENHIHFSLLRKEANNNKELLNKTSKQPQIQKILLPRKHPWNNQQNFQQQLTQLFEQEQVKKILHTTIMKAITDIITTKRFKKKKTKK